METFKFFKGYKGPPGKNSQMPEKIELEPLPDVCDPNKKPEKLNKNGLFEKKDMNPMEMLNRNFFKIY